MNIVCISNIDWQSSWQRHQTFMTQFAEAGHRILFINNTGFRSIKLRDLRRIKDKIFGSQNKINPSHPNVKVINPWILPSSGFFGKFFNEKIFLGLLIKKIANLGFGKVDLAFLYLPTQFSRRIVEILKPDKIVYDYVCDFLSHPSVPPDFASTHNSILELSDLVLTDNNSLYCRLKKQHQAVYLLHHGVEEIFFQGSTYKKRHINKLCYFGTIDSEVLDFNLINEISKLTKQIDLIGPVRGPMPKTELSVRILSPLPLKVLAKKLMEYDGIIFPYKNSDFNKSVMPAKIYQCFGSGLPIFSFNLPQLRGFAENGLLYCLDSVEDAKRIFGKIEEIEGEEMFKMRVELARENSTLKKFRTLTGLIDHLN